LLSSTILRCVHWELHTFAQPVGSSADFSYQTFPAD
jgi:hypothetical protein